MRSHEYVSSRIIDVNGNGVKVVEHVLCLPDDFTAESSVVESVTFNGNEFRVSDFTASDFARIEERVHKNPELEYGIVRAGIGSDIYTSVVLEGTNSSIGFKIYPKELYENGHIALRDYPQIDIFDFVHNHPLGERDDVDPMIFNLFSGGDILCMGRDRAIRYWVLSPDGGAYCLMNPIRRQYGDEFNDPAYEYGSKFRTGYTFDEAKRDLMTCVNKCSLQLFHSSDRVNFTRVLS